MYDILKPQILNGVLSKFNAPEDFMGMAMFPTETHPFPTVKYDVIRGSRNVAKFNVPNAEANIVGQGKVDYMTADFLYAREKKVFDPVTLYWLRAPGTMSEKNANYHVTREIRDLDLRNERLVEYSIWQALSGSLSIDNPKLKANIDFMFDETHKPTVTVKWDDPTADILGDVTAFKKLIKQDASAKANKAFLTSETMEYFIKNTGIFNLMDADMKKQYLSEGTIPGLLGLNWVINDEVYQDDAGNLVNYIPDGRVIMLADTNADGTKPFALLEGPSADITAGVYYGKFAKSWKVEDPSAEQVLVERTWFPAIKYPENIVVATVL